ncbi:MAG TPA: hypothetical protein VFP65_09835 [Anaeromyxobacteraceae bacterium]|nr:hypothetical protein [Anaeromyxobacteraceae bacterium]
MEPSERQEAAQEPAPPARRPGALALAFAVAAALSCWNPLAAPLAVLVGVAAAIMGFRALRRGGRRLAASAAALGLVAAAAAVVVLALTASAVGVEQGGEAVVEGRSTQEMDRILDDAARRTREARERARGELDKLSAPDAGTPPRQKP